MRPVGSRARSRSSRVRRRARAPPRRAGSRPRARRSCVADVQYDKARAMVSEIGVSSAMVAPLDVTDPEQWDRAGASHGRRVRPPRRAREQRRDRGTADAARGGVTRGSPTDPRGEPRRRDAGDARGRRAHARPVPEGRERRVDRQHRVDRRSRRRCRDGELHGEQVRCHRAHAHRGPRARSPRHPR